jgi:hypothetical protein
VLYTKPLYQSGFPAAAWRGLALIVRARQADRRDCEPGRHFEKNKLFHNLGHSQPSGKARIGPLNAEKNRLQKSVPLIFFVISVSFVVKIGTTFFPRWAAGVVCRRIAHEVRALSFHPAGRIDLLSVPAGG